MWRLYLDQGQRCALSGVEIRIEQGCVQHRRNRSTASLDRIDNSKGYVRGNVQWVHKDVNKMKRDLNEARFLELCRLIAKQRRSR